MSVVKHAVISAAGLGSRLELNMPKCLVQIGERKIIDYQLDLLQDVEDVRIVTGFMESEVIDYVKSVRRDVVFVRNPDYRTTSNAYSLHLATRDLDDPFLMIDGDLLVEPSSFEKFLEHCTNGSAIGITKSKTQDAVFVDYEDGSSQIHGFRREPARAYEWANVAYLKDIKISGKLEYVYHELERHLPLTGVPVESYEVDTPEDLEVAIKSFVPPVARRST